jgi:hypothetical protein
MPMEIRNVAGHSGTVCRFLRSRVQFAPVVASVTVESAGVTDLPFQVDRLLRAGVLQRLELFERIFDQRIDPRLRFGAVDTEHQGVEVVPIDIPLVGGMTLITKIANGKKSHAKSA